MGVYVTYRQHTGKTRSPVDWDPTTYSCITIFSEDKEVEALRYANLRGLRVVKMESGERLEDVVNTFVQMNSAVDRIESTEEG